MMSVVTKGVERVDATDAAITIVEKDSTVQVNRGKYFKTRENKKQNMAMKGQKNSGSS